MDILTQRLIAFRKKILAELRRLSDSIRQHEQAQQERHEAEQEQQRPSDIAGIGNAIESIAQSQKTAHDTKKWYKDRSFWVSLAGVIVVAAYTFLTYRQWNTMDKTYKSSIESFRMDERAWVEIEPIKPVSISPPDHKFSAGFSCSIYPKNVGKTVARRILVRAAETLRTAEFSRSEVENVQWNTLRATKVTLEITPNPAQVDQTQEIGGHVEGIVPANPVPEVLSPNTIASAPFSVSCQATKDYPSGGHAYSFIVGRIDYCDTFNVRHWKTFCFYVANARGDVWNCRQGNDEDSNPETDPTEKCSK
jgi:hypothetical protein